MNPNQTIHQTAASLGEKSPHETPAMQLCVQRPRLLPLGEFALHPSLAVSIGNPPTRAPRTSKAGFDSPWGHHSAEQRLTKERSKNVVDTGVLA